MKYSSKILFISFLLFINGCLKDKEIPLVSFDLDKSAKMLRYLEGQGDYINSDQAPSLISVDEVYNNLDQMIVLDIRSADIYSAGHIQNSINVQSERLYEATDSLFKSAPTKKIVIVSKNGQASAYFVCLLRLMGFYNTYSLKYGMAYWNKDFSDEWLTALGNDSELNLYDNQLFAKSPMSELPKLNIPSSINDDKEITNFRIKEVIRAGFKTDINYSYEFNYSVKNSNVKICYGPFSLYYMPQYLGGLGHAQGTIWFMNKPVYDFRSVNSLQTLPANTPIIIYTGDGQLGAAVTAYLTVFGYNVKTLLFGANQLFYSRMASDPNLIDDTFNPNEIRNYPYVTGS